MTICKECKFCNRPCDSYALCKHPDLAIVTNGWTNKVTGEVNRPFLTYHYCTSIRSVRDTGDDCKFFEERPPEPPEEIEVKEEFSWRKFFNTLLEYL
jgi:hypothetical protein